ncbi:MAG: beta-galactosidase [Verrucomicrobia bacterium]|nr:beta-galactosidase [Verrucomicrobiota bacterium]
MSALLIPAPADTDANHVFDVSFLGDYRVTAGITNAAGQETSGEWGVTFTGEQPTQVITQLWQAVRAPAGARLEASLKVTAPSRAWFGRVGWRAKNGGADLHITSIKIDSEPLKSVWDIPQEDASQGNASWRANWIVVDESGDLKAYAVIAEKSHRYFTRKFDLKEKPSKAMVAVAADDQSRIWVNGQLIGETTKWSEPGCFDIKPQVKAGENLLCIELYNDGSYYGLLAELKADFGPSGTETRLLTDSEWMGSVAKPEGWPNQPAGQPARIYGKAGSAPWGVVPDPVWEIGSAARSSDLLPLEKPTFPEAAIRSAKGRSCLTVNGQPAPAMQYLEAQGSGPGVISRLKRHGIHIIQVNLGDFGWKADGLYDFTDVDRRLKRVLAVNPEALLIPAFDVGTHWWAGRHPEGAALGPSGKLDLQAYAGATGVFPCFVHPGWRKDVGAAVAQLVRHLGRSDLGQRVIGLKACNGISWEWFYWGAQSEQFADYNPAMLAAYQEWLRAKGIADAEVRQAKIPTPKEWRRGRKFFRDPADSGEVIRFARFWQEMVAETFDWLAAIIKRESRGWLLVGSYFGYTLEFTEASHLGQMAGAFALSKILRSPNVDIIYSPTGYCFRKLGEPGTTMPPTGTINLNGKLYSSEADYRTHWSNQDIARTTTIAEDVAAFRREFALSFMTGADIELLDFSQGYQTGDERLMAEMARFKAIRQRLKDREEFFQSDDLAVITGEDIEIQSLGNPPVFGELVARQRPDLFCAGVRHHHFLSADLANPILQKFRCFLFLNCWKLDEKQWAAVEALKSRGRTLIFVYAPGAWDGKGMSAERLSRLTGIAVAKATAPVELRAKWLAPVSLPVPAQQTGGLSGGNGHEFGLAVGQMAPVAFLPVTGDRMEILATRPSSEEPLVVRMKSKDWTSVYSAVPHLSPTVLRELFRAAGLHIFSETDDGCYPSSVMVGLHTKEGGVKKITLPKSHKRIYDLVTDQTLGERTNQVQIETEAKRTYLIGWE